MAKKKRRPKPKKSRPIESYARTPEQSDQVAQAREEARKTREAKLDREGKQKELDEFVRAEVTKLGMDPDSDHEQIKLIFDMGDLPNKPPEGADVDIEGFYVEDYNSGKRLCAWVAGYGPVEVKLLPIDSTEYAEGWEEIGPAQINLSTVRPTYTGAQAAAKALEEMPFVGVGKHADDQKLSELLDWIEGLEIDLSSPVAYAKGAAATELIHDIVESSLSGTSGDEFRALLGDGDWKDRQISELVEVVRTVWGDVGLLDQTFGELRSKAERADERDALGHAMNVAKDHPFTATRKDAEGQKRAEMMDEMVHAKTDEDRNEVLRKYGFDPQSPEDLRLLTFLGDDHERSYSPEVNIPVGFMRTKPYEGYKRGTDAIPQFFYGDEGEFELVAMRNEVWLSTAVLRNLTVRAAGQDALRPLDEYLVARLDPNARHFVRLAYRFTREGKRDFIRCAISLKMYGKGTVEDAICDLPVRQFGVMLAQLDHSKGVGGPTVLHDIVERALDRGGRVNVKPGLPNWQGTNSMPKVWSAQEDIWDLAFSADVMGVDALAHSIYEKTDSALSLEDAKKVAMVGESPRALFAGHALDQLHQAVPIIVEPAQVEALPDWEEEQSLWDYTTELAMPHNVIYLDFEGPGGIVPTVNSTVSSATGMKSRTRMRGALVYRDTDDNLVVMPVGWTGVFGEDGWHGRREGSPLDGIGWGDLDIAGRVVFNGSTPAAEISLSRMTGDVLEDHLVDYNNLLVTVPTATCAASFRDWKNPGTKRQHLPGRVELPFGKSMLQTTRPEWVTAIEDNAEVRAVLIENNYDPDKVVEIMRRGSSGQEQDDLRAALQVNVDVGNEAAKKLLDSLDRVDPGLAEGSVIGWATTVYIMAEKAVAALSILEAEEIELVPASLTKHERRKAEKKGYPIAEQVRIKPVPKRYVYTGKDTRSGEPRNFQFCFWRRGHVRHHAVGSLIADARPDLVTECPRTVGSCGMCRRVKVKPCIVGPRDRPLKAKSLVIESQFNDPLEEEAA